MSFSRNKRDDRGYKIKTGHLFFYLGIILWSVALFGRMTPLGVFRPSGEYLAQLISVFGLNAPDHELSFQVEAPILGEQVLLLKLTDFNKDYSLELARLEKVGSEDIYYKKQFFLDSDLVLEFDRIKFIPGNWHLVLAFKNKDDSEETLTKRWEDYLLISEADLVGSSVVDSASENALAGLSLMDLFNKLGMANTSIIANQAVLLGSPEQVRLVFLASDFEKTDELLRLLKGRVSEFPDNGSVLVEAVMEGLKLRLKIADGNVESRDLLDGVFGLVVYYSLDNSKRVELLKGLDTEELNKFEEMIQERIDYLGGIN